MIDPTSLGALSDIRVVLTTCQDVQAIAGKSRPCSLNAGTSVKANSDNGAKRIANEVGHVGISGGKKPLEDFDGQAQKKS